MKTAEPHRVVVEGLIGAVALTAISYIVASLAGWVPDGVNYLEAFAVFTSYACTYLAVKQKRFNYAFGVLSTVAYCILFAQQGLIASAILNAYLTPSLVYGWIRWKSDNNSLPVTHVAWKWLPAYFLVTAVAYVGATALVAAFDGQLGTWDAVILVGSILAQLLLDNKKIETWIIWAVVNVAAIYVYFSSGLPLAGFQYVFFLGNAVYGYTSWRRAMK
jgi:nicotinamide mononucleotide transporter